MYMWILFAVATIISGPAYALTCSSNTSLDIVGGFSMAEAQRFVSDVNQIRMGLVSPYPESMYVLEWNNDLAQQAQYAIDNQCTTQTAPLPLPANQREDMAGFSLLGQSGPTEIVSTSDRIAYVLSVWNNGKYTYSDDCAAAKQAGTVCGTCAGTTGMNACLAYTQLIWAKTHAVGCGASICNSKRYITCLYGPAGNVVGEAPYKRATSPISKCDYYSSGTPSDDGDGFFDTGKEWKIPLIALGGAGVMLAGGVVYFCEGEDCSSSRDADDGNSRRRRSPSKKVKFNFHDDASLQQLTEADNVA